MNKAQDVLDTFDHLAQLRPTLGRETICQLTIATIVYEQLDRLVRRVDALGFNSETILPDLPMGTTEKIAFQLGEISTALTQLVEEIHDGDRGTDT